jgi:hypothetical protein
MFLLFNSPAAIMEYFSGERSRNTIWCEILKLQLGLDLKKNLSLLLGYKITAWDVQEIQV